MGELDRHRRAASRSEAELARQDREMRTESDALAREFADRMTAHRVGKTVLYEVHHSTTSRRTFWNHRLVTNNTYEFDQKAQGWLLGCTDTEWKKNYLFLTDDLRTVQTPALVQQHPAPNAPPTPFVAVDDFNGSIVHTHLQIPHILDLMTETAYRLAP
jgi:hypothetical protein